MFAGSETPELISLFGLMRSLISGVGSDALTLGEQRRTPQAWLWE